MHHLMHVARTRRATKMTLEVRAQNVIAQALYRKLGFRPVGVRPNYYLEEHEDAIVMLQELPQEEE